jgi:GNAT superfamily N-acetyltransferase
MGERRGGRDRPSLRPATVADAAEMGKVAFAAWQWAYRGVLPDELLDGLTVDEFTERWERRLRTAPASSFCLHAEVEGAVVGFVAGGPNRDETTAPHSGEIYAINVHPDRVGRGIGRALFAAGCNQLVEGGSRHAILWVLRGNARARRFYEVAGWRPEEEDRVVKDWFRGHELDEVRYAVDLVPEPKP